jgi:hypothetical protein
MATVGVVIGGAVIVGLLGYGIYRYAKNDFSSN